MSPIEQAGSAKPPVALLARARVRDEMTAGVVGCDPDASTATVADLMAERSVHCVVVAGVRTEARHDELSWGIVSDLDVLCALGGLSSDTTAGELARRRVVTAEPNETMFEAAKRMAAAGMTHLVVVEDARPVGVVSSADVMRAAAGVA